MGLDVLKNNFQLVLLLLAWLIMGAYAGPIVILFIPLTILLLYLNNKIPEIFFGFLFVLVISDNLEEPMMFAKSFKNIYILIFSSLILINLENIINKITIYLYFVPYFILAGIGIIYSPVLGTSVQKLLSYILLFMCVPNYVSLCYQLQGKIFFRNLIYFMFSIIVIGFLLRFIWPEVAFSHGGRLRGVFGNPNGLGIFMVVFFLLYSTVRIKYPSLFRRHEHLLIIIITLYFTYKTGSRAALIAILIYFPFSRIFQTSVFLGFLFFFIVLLSSEMLVFYFPKIIVGMGMEKSFRVETLNEGSGRIIAWEFAWQNIQKSLLIGKGLAFDEYLMRSNFEMLSKAGHEGGVHNTYLIMWLNTGLIGLLFFLRAFFILFYKASLKHKQAFPLMFSIMLSINFEPWLAASLNPYTIIYLIIISLLTESYFEDENNELIIETND